MFSWNWAATESASVVEEAVTIAVVSHAPPLATIFIVSVAYDTEALAGVDEVLAAEFRQHGPASTRLLANPDGYLGTAAHDTLADRAALDIVRKYARAAGLDGNHHHPQPARHRRRPLRSRRSRLRAYR
jgi:hypothetical protein